MSDNPSKELTERLAACFSYHNKSCHEACLEGLCIHMSHARTILPFILSERTEMMERCAERICSRCRTDGRPIFKVVSTYGSETYWWHEYGDEDIQNSRCDAHHVRTLSPNPNWLQDQIDECQKQTYEAVCIELGISDGTKDVEPPDGDYLLVIGNWRKEVEREAVKQGATYMRFWCRSSIMERAVNLRSVGEIKNAESLELLAEDIGGAFSIKKARALLAHEDGGG